MLSGVLILFTNNFPEMTGDGNFVRHEIQGLSAAYSRVIVAPLFETGKPRYLVPDNVDVLEPIYSSRSRLLIRGVVNRSPLSVLLRLFREDLPSLKSIQQLKQFATAILIGRAVASHEPILKALRQDGAATLYFYWGNGSAYGMPWLNLGDRPVFMRLHGTDLYEDVHNGYIPCRISLLGATDVLIPISDHGAIHARSTLGRLGVNARVVVSKLGTKIPTTVKPTEPKERLDEVHLVSISSINAIKRVPRILETVCEISKIASVTWTHFGDGPGMKTLQAAASTVPASLTVDLRGNVCNDEIQLFLASTRIDCFLNLSASEGLPVSILEAASHNIPIVASDVGGTSEFVGVDKGTGLLVDRDADIPSVAQAVQFVVDNRLEWRPRDHWGQWHSADRCVARLVQILQGDQ